MLLYLKFSFFLSTLKSTSSNYYEHVQQQFNSFKVTSALSTLSLLVHWGMSLKDLLIVCLVSLQSTIVNHIFPLANTI